MVAQSGCLLADLDLLGHEIARGGPLGERIRDNEYGGITATRVAARMKEALDPASVEVQWDIVFDGPRWEDKPYAPPSDLLDHYRRNQSVSRMTYTAQLPSLADDCVDITVRRAFDEHRDEHWTWRGVFPAEHEAIEVARGRWSRGCVIVVTPVRVDDTHLDLLVVRGGGSVLMRERIGVPRAGMLKATGQYAGDAALTAISTPALVVCSVFLPVRWCAGR